MRKTKDDLQGLEYGGYQVFANEWKTEEVHKFTYDELVEFIEGLEYSTNELLNYRSEYYAKKKANKSNYASSSKSDKYPYADEEAAF